MTCSCKKRIWKNIKGEAWKECILCNKKHYIITTKDYNNLSIEQQKVYREEAESRTLPQTVETEGTIIACNQLCGKCGALCWKPEDGVKGRIWSGSWGYSCRECNKKFHEELGPPVFLHTLNGKEAICAKFLLGKKRALELEHNKIYTAEELRLTGWLITQKGQKKPSKVKCMRG